MNNSQKWLADIARLCPWSVESDEERGITKHAIQAKKLYSRCNDCGLSYHARAGLAKDFQDDC